MTVNAKRMSKFSVTFASPGNGSQKTRQTNKGANPMGHGSLSSRSTNKSEAPPRQGLPHRNATLPGPGDRLVVAGGPSYWTLKGSKVRLGELLPQFKKIKNDWERDMAITEWTHGMPYGAVLMPGSEEQAQIRAKEMERLGSTSRHAASDTPRAEQPTRSRSKASPSIPHPIDPPPYELSNLMLPAHVVPLVLKEVNKRNPSLSGLDLEAAAYAVYEEMVYAGKLPK